MAKINRFNGNVQAFGSQAQGTERTVFGDITQSDTLDANITADFLRGWGIVGVNENPTKQDFNGLAFTLGQLIAYLHQMGVPEWNPGQEYYAGSVVTTEAGIYQLKPGGDGTVDPDSDDGTNWNRAPTAESVNQRVIYADSVAELEALPGPITGQQALVGGCPFKYNGSEWKPTAHVTPEIYGATFDGTDDAPAWNAMAAAIEPGQVVKSSTPGGTSTCNSTVTFTKDVIFDMPDINVVMTGGDFNITGAIETLTATLSANASKGENSFTVSDGTQFAENDVIIIQNADDFSFSLHRAEYQDGEFLTVRNVAANTVELTSGLLSSYLAAGNIQFHKVSPVFVSMKGIRFSGGALDNLVELDLVKDFSMEFTDVKGGANRALSLRRCYGGKIVGGEFEYKGPAGGTSYGISVANCQDLEIKPVRSHGTRHGIATGGFAGAGAIPCRNVLIKSAVVSSTDSHAADIHGNAENCYYIDCNIYGGTGIGGKNCGVVGGTVIQRDGAAQATLQWTEVVGGKMTFKGLKATLPANSAGRLAGPSSSLQFGSISEDVYVEVSDIFCEIPASNTSSVPVSWSVTYPGTVRTRMEIKGIEFTGDTSGISTFFAGDLSNSAGHAVPPIPFDEFILDDINMDLSSIDFWTSNGGTFGTGTKVTMPKLSFSGEQTVSAGGHISSGLSGSFPSYTITPQVFPEYSGSGAIGGTWILPLCTAASPTAATIALTTMHTSETVTANVTERVSARVGLDKFTWP